MRNRSAERLPSKDRRSETRALHFSLAHAWPHFLSGRATALKSRSCGGLSGPVVEAFLFWNQSENTATELHKRVIDPSTSLGCSLRPASLPLLGRRLRGFDEQAHRDGAGDVLGHAVVAGL